MYHYKQDFGKLYEKNLKIAKACKENNNAFMSG